MPLQPLLILAVASMAMLAVLRLARVRLGRTPLPDGRARLLFRLAFVIAPPVALGALIQPATAESPLRGLGWVPPYAFMLFAVLSVMWIVAAIVQLAVPGRSRPVLLLALVGSEGDPEDVPFDPPVTPQLAEGVALVDRANAVFPRGWDFPAQIGRASFRIDWDSLDAATGTLEGRIADDHRLGVAVASAAKATAADARSRLDTLRRLAGDAGQAWATAT